MLVAIGLAATVAAQAETTHKLTRLRESAATLEVPEGAIPDGMQLNDLVSDGKDTLYVSDSKGKAQVLLDETVLKGSNGLLVHDGVLQVLDNNSLKRVEPGKSLEVLADGMPGGVDGLENVKGRPAPLTSAGTTKP